MFERLKEFRKQLHLSQEFVAKQLNMARTTLVAIETGKRKVTAEELAKFSRLYGVSADEILNGKVDAEGEVAMFARTFSTLSDDDKKEILSLMSFKKRYKESMGV